jgi:hypothetical protein
VVLQKKEDYMDLEVLEPLEKNNLPFYFVRPAEIQKLKKLGSAVTSKEIK